jgi:galactokinase
MRSGPIDPPIRAEDAMVRPFELATQFRHLFGKPATLYRAPGRVNLIGEHTDYNDGFVMPAAIDYSCWIAAAPRTDRKIAVHSKNFSETVELDLNQSSPRARRHWSDYVFGTALMLDRAGFRLVGADMVISSDVPIGAGLSSSAALEVALAFAALDLTGIRLDRKLLALTCQRAENEFVGARCGVMDQFIATHAVEGECLKLDCRSLDFRALPLPSELRVVICNTMVKHAIASGEYNLRRSQCEEGTRLLSRVAPGIKALRDVSSEIFDQYSWLLGPLITKRCRHVITENERVHAFAAALEKRSLGSIEKLMAESHVSLRDDYDVSCPELNIMVELAQQVDGVHGARMTGRGFGGCTVNLVVAEAVEEFRDFVARGYEAKTGIAPEIYETASSSGATRIS